MTGFLDTLTEDQLKEAMEYRGEDDHPAPYPSHAETVAPYAAALAPDELEVVAWHWKQNGGMEAHTFDEPKHQDGLTKTPLVRLTDAQAAIACQTDYAKEWEHHCKAAEARVAELEKDYTELLRDNQKLTCQAVDAEYYGGMVDRIREILRDKYLDSFQKEIRIKQLLGED